MEPLSEALRQVAADPPPTTIDVDRIVAAEQRRARHRHWAAGTAAVALAVAVVISGGSIVGTRALVARYGSTVNKVDALPTHPGRAALNGPVNFLVVGIDGRNGPSGLVRSDTIIVVHIPASHDRAYLVSIPRDTAVEIPAFPPTGYRGGHDKIDAAYALGSMGNGGRAGGLKLLAETIRQMSGITVDGAAVVDFAGFRNVVEALGGVHMCVDEKTVSLHIGIDRNGRYAPPFTTAGGQFTPVPGVTPVVYEPGCRDLAPWQALDYIRQRVFIPDGDYGRQRHQQQLLAAIATRAMSSGVLSNPAKLDALVRAAGGGLTVDFGGADLLDWMATLKSVGPDDIVMIRTNGGHYQPVKVDGVYGEQLSPDSRQLLQAVRDDTVADFLGRHPDWVVEDR
ncbi:MAG TPA: LCP family protein [Micromonosporaceae bacterium]